MLTESQFYVQVLAEMVNQYGLPPDLFEENDQLREFMLEHFKIDIDAPNDGEKSFHEVSEEIRATLECLLCSLGKKLGVELKFMPR